MPSTNNLSNNIDMNRSLYGRRPESDHFRLLDMDSHNKLCDDTGQIGRASLFAYLDWR
jgi:hypothetical protein